MMLNSTQKCFFDFAYLAAPVGSGLIGACVGTVTSNNMLAAVSGLGLSLILVALLLGMHAIAHK